MPATGGKQSLRIAASFASYRQWGDFSLSLEDASALLDAGSHAEAREVLSSIVLKEAPTSLAESYALRGWSWFQEKKYEHALKDFNKAIALVADAENTLYLRARCREELNDPDGAMADYQTVLRINPNTPDAWEGASLIHRYFGRLRDADECAAEAVRARS